jgi:hypothetical protein
MGQSAHELPAAGDTEDTAIRTVATGRITDPQETYGVTHLRQVGELRNPAIGNKPIRFGKERPDRIDIFEIMPSYLKISYYLIVDSRPAVRVFLDEIDIY